MTGAVRILAVTVAAANGDAVVDAAAAAAPKADLAAATFRRPNMHPLRINAPRIPGATIIVVNSLADLSRADRSSAAMTIAEAKARVTLLPRPANPKSFYFPVSRSQNIATGRPQPRLFRHRNTSRTNSALT